jgi:hypothetical protein
MAKRRRRRSYRKNPDLNKVLMIGGIAVPPVAPPSGGGGGGLLSDIGKFFGGLIGGATKSPNDVCGKGYRLEGYTAKGTPMCVPVTPNDLEGYYDYHTNHYIDG